MDTSIHSHIVAQHIQGRMDEATSQRLARQVSPPREPKLPHLRRLLRRRAPATSPVRTSAT